MLSHEACLLAAMLLHAAVAVPLPKSETHLQQTSSNIIDYVTKGKGAGRAYQHLSKFTDRFGNRMAGTSRLERALDYALETLRADGFDNVHAEEFKFPRWTRGAESGQLLSPVKKPIAVKGLGYR